MGSAVIADVLVVGAGPAGAAAAITLARAGREVVVVDKATFPRDKCCGDGLTTGALRRLEALGLDPRGVASWRQVDDVWVRSPSGRTVRFPLPRGRGTYAAIARRSDLDAALVDLARDAGVKVFDGHAATSVTEIDGGLLVHADGIGSIAARYAVAADGMWSQLRKSLALSEPGYLGEWHAFRQYFRTTTPEAQKLWVWFDADLLPGYAWSFPLADGRVNVGFGLRRVAGRSMRSMKEIWPELLARPHVRAVLGEPAPEAPHKAWPIPARAGSARTGAGGRVLFVGDAARATDPMTGEGIGQAIETAVLAAEAIIGAGPLRPARAADRYDRALRTGLDVDNSLAGALSNVLQSPLRTRGAIRVAGSTDWTRRSFARWLFEDYPRAILATPHRWHRGMLTGAGAYQWLRSGASHPSPEQEQP